MSTSNPSGPQSGSQSPSAPKEAQPSQGGSSGGDVHAQEKSYFDRLKAEAEKVEERVSQSIAEARSKIRKDYQDSEQGRTRAEQEEAERIMRLPTPEALKEMGAVVGDPTKGPSA